MKPAALALTLLFAVTQLQAASAAAAPIDFTISVPNDLTSLPLAEPTVGQSRLMERALARLEACPVLHGVRDAGFKGYEYSCIESNFYILLALLATSVRVYSNYIETFPQFRRACDTANMRHDGDGDSRKFVGSFGAAAYGLEKSCTDGYLVSLHGAIQSAFIAHARD